MGTLTILFIIIAATIVFGAVIAGKISSVIHTPGPSQPGKTLAQSFLRP